MFVVSLFLFVCGTCDPAQTGSWPESNGPTWHYIRSAWWNRRVPVPLIRSIYGSIHFIQLLQARILFGSLFHQKGIFVLQFFRQHGITLATVSLTSQLFLAPVSPESAVEQHTQTN